MNVDVDQNDVMGGGWSKNTVVWSYKIKQYLQELYLLFSIFAKRAARMLSPLNYQYEQPTLLVNTKQ